MSNPISKEVKIGTLGELLVQIRLLQYDVQAAPPLKDSGNDLIAAKGDVFKSIQVKTINDSDRFDLREIDRKIINVVALVRLIGEDREVSLDDTDIFLLTKDDIADKQTISPETISDKILTNERINEIWV